MSLSFTSCRVSEAGSSTLVLPQPAARHILLGRMKLNWGGRGSVPTARVRLAFFSNCEGNKGWSVQDIDWEAVGGSVGGKGKLLPIRTKPKEKWGGNSIQRQIREISGQWGPKREV